MKNILKTILVTVGLFIASTALATPYTCYNTYSGQNCGTDYVMSGLNCGAATDPGDPNASSVASWDAYCDALTHGSGVNCLSTAWNAAFNAGVCRCDTGYTGSACDTCATNYILIGGNCVYFSSHSIIYDDDVTGSSATPDTYVSTVNPVTGADYDKISLYASGGIIGLLDPAGDTLTLNASTNDGSTNIIDGQDSDDVSQFYVDTDGEINGYRLATTPNQLGTIFGPETLSDTSIEAWTDANTPTTWGILPYPGPSGATVTREAGTVHTGTYSAALYGGVGGGGGNYIYQCSTGQTPADDFGVGFWVYGTAGDQFEVMVYNDDPITGTPTEMWDDATSAWIAFSLPPSAKVFNLAATDWNNEGLLFPVPASGTMCYLFSAQDTKTAYLDDVTAVTIVTTPPMALFDFLNPTDESKMGLTDYLFKFRTTGGTPKTWLAMNGSGIFESDLTVLNFGLEDITTAADISITGSGDLSVADESYLNDVEVALLTNDLSGASSDYIITLTDVTARTTPMIYNQMGSASFPVATDGASLQTNILATTANAASAYEARIDSQGLAAGELISGFNSLLYDHASDEANSFVAGYVAKFSVPTAGLGKAVGFLTDNRVEQLDYDLMSVGYDLRLRAELGVGATGEGPDIVFDAGEAQTEGKGGGFIFNAGDAATAIAADLVGGGFKIDLGMSTGSAWPGLFTIALDGNDFLDVTSTDMSEVYTASHATGAGAVGYILGILEDMTTGQYLLKITDNLAAVSEDIVKIAYDGAVELGTWGKIDTLSGSTNSMNFTSGASGNVEAFTFNTGSVNSGYKLITVKNDGNTKLFVMDDGAIFSGADANTTDFPSTQGVFSNADTGFGFLSETGLLGEAVASAAQYGAGVAGFCETSSAQGCYGGYFASGVTDSTDTDSSRAVQGVSIATRTGLTGTNTAFYANADNGIANYSFYGLSGKMFNEDEVLIGAEANNTDYPNAQVVISTVDIGASSSNVSGLVVEAVAIPAQPAYAIASIAISKAQSGYGVYAGAQPSASSDAGDAVGLFADSSRTHSGGDNLAVYANATGSDTANWSFFGAAGNMYNSGAVQIGSSTLATDFPNAKVMVSQADTGYTTNDRVGIISEATADGSNNGVGLVGVAETSSAKAAYGVQGIGRVNLSTDALNAVGVYGTSTETHAGGLNVGGYFEANNSATVTDKDYGIFVADGKTKLLGGLLRNTRAITATPAQTTQEDDIMHVTQTATEAVSLVLETDTCNDVFDYGRQITVKDAGGLAGTNNITVSTEGAEKIDGADTYVINSNYASIDLYCYGNNWFVH